MYNGIINVYKEKGYTSFDVVAKLRGILHQKKIGHTGTLDPDAYGVLPVCLGSGTKLCDMLTDKDKTYETVLLLGVTTDTQDISGQIIQKNEVAVTKEEIVAAALSYVGEYDQIPPMYSAIKVNGKKLYELAREGKTIERKARRITINSIDIMDVDIPRVRMSVSCSKGTYIRTLCNDIGEKLGCGGCVEELKRTKSGQFDISQSYSLSDIENMVKNGDFEKIITPVEKVFENLKAVHVKEQWGKILYNGNPLKKDYIEEDIQPQVEEKFRVYSYDRKFIGIYRCDEALLYRPEKIFSLD